MLGVLGVAVAGSLLKLPDERRMLSAEGRFWSIAFGRDGWLDLAFVGCYHRMQRNGGGVGDTIVSLKHRGRSDITRWRLIGFFEVGGTY